MIGTFVNVGTIIIGSLLGGLVKKIISQRINDALFNAMGLAAFGLGINAVVQNMPNTKYPVLFIASLAIGGIIGTLLDLDGRVGRLTSRGGGDDPADPDTEERSRNNRLGQGLVTGSLLYCVGTLSILGPVQSALYQDHTYLFTNATLDLVTSMVLASTYGVGMCLAAGILFLWQCSIYGLTLLCGSFITDTMM
ncbi:MAG: DUF554 domain-containing protein, partial [Firmicutes bacterium]|nr:DUF554 domain-containing protein [Bacillota bacterium]